MFPCKFCNFFENTIFTEHLQVTASAFEHSQLTFYLFQNDVLYFVPYSEGENASDIKIWCFVKLND